MSNIHVFVSFDIEHDEELYALIREQSRAPGSGFAVSGGSGCSTKEEDAWSERVRREIQEADEVIIICGEHTDCSERVGSELRITQEEKRPYFLLWGRRELMCTKPATAKPADSMYSWTWDVLQSQIDNIRRTARSNERIAELRRAKATAKGPR
jgi:hypothetical protein